MAGKGYGEGEENFLKLESQISLLKYIICAMNGIEWMIGVSIMALCLWLRFEPGITEWLEILHATDFYNGVYVLIFAAIIIMVVPFLGCFSALNESSTFILIYIATQVVAFIFGLAGAAVLLDNSARNSKLQPHIRESMRNLIMNAHHEQSRQTLSMIQENIACCGADGASDYLELQQPLPTECRDTVTGNPFYHGCVDELTWFFEQKCGWIAALTMTVCFLHVINIVLSTVLMQALSKEDAHHTDTYQLAPTNTKQRTSTYSQ